MRRVDVIAELERISREAPEWVQAGAVDVLMWLRTDDDMADAPNPRPCPACGAMLGYDETHWSLGPAPMGAYVCPVRP